MHVAIGGRLGDHVAQRGVLVQQPVLQAGTVMARAAVQADGAGQAAVQLDHVAAAGTLVQAVDILRDQRREPAVRAKARQRMVRGIGPRLPRHRPAQHAARPVALAPRVRAKEGLQRDRRRALPLSARIAVAGDAGVGADAGAGQHEQARMALHEVEQRAGAVLRWWQRRVQLAVSSARAAWRASQARSSSR
ncbi:hypothetical protein D3C72_1270390 [compost metagenome]